MSDSETYEEHCARTIREIVRNLLYVHNVHNLSAVQLSMFQDSLQNSYLTAAMRQATEKALAVQCRHMLAQTHRQFPLDRPSLRGCLHV